MAQLTIDYTNERRQFGKPVATFQAVQQHLVLATQSAVRAQMAADVAVRELAAGAGSFEIAAARVVVDDAITVGTRAAHQAHGAMGRHPRVPPPPTDPPPVVVAARVGHERSNGANASVAAAGADTMFDLVTSR